MEGLEGRILELKKKLNALIVAHNYQRPEVQDIADITGDSLELARECTKVDCETIVFCGVRFMAESAAILNPDRTVLLSEESAGCPLADMIDIDDLREWQQRYPKAAVVSYVNSSAAVKAESDFCCTSANSIKLIESIPNGEILFVPDQYLGHYTSAKTDKRLILYPGYCPVHRRLKAEHIIRAKELYPDAAVIVHPECIPDGHCLSRCRSEHVTDAALCQGKRGQEFPHWHRDWNAAPVAKRKTRERTSTPCLWGLSVPI